MYVVYCLNVEVEFRVKVKIEVVRTYKGNRLFNINRQADLPEIHGEVRQENKPY